MIEGLKTWVSLSIDGLILHVHRESESQKGASVIAYLEVNVIFRLEFNYF